MDPIGLMRIRLHSFAVWIATGKQVVPQLEPAASYSGLRPSRSQRRDVNLTGQTGVLPIWRLASPEKSVLLQKRATWPSCGVEWRSGDRHRGRASSAAIIVAVRRRWSRTELGPNELCQNSPPRPEPAQHSVNALRRRPEVLEQRAQTQASLRKFQKLSRLVNEAPAC
jgi:hypothetical protein